MIAGLANRNDVLPLYIGDDLTDEYAFKVSNPCHGIMSSKPMF